MDVSGNRTAELLSTLKGWLPAEFHDDIFLVGGSVRDILRGRPASDVDLFATLAPEDLLRLGFRLVTPRSAATLFFRVHPRLGKMEVTRSESGQGLAADLMRRDFTVNAMAMNLQGDLIDPLGGRQAMAAGRLVPCSTDTFVADPARIFRAFRFETDGWRLATEAELLIRAVDWREKMAGLPPERFTQEMLKALESGDPARFFQRLLEFSVGDTFLPELFRFPSVVAGPPGYHPEGDLLGHSLNSLRSMAALTADLTPRFCALFHDIGKLATPPDRYPRHLGHEDAGAGLAVGMAERLRLPACLKKALMAASRLHMMAGRWPELRDTTRFRIAEDAAKGGIAGFLPLLVAADKQEPVGMAGWETVLEVLALSTAELGIAPELLREEKEPSGGGGEERCPIPPAERQAYVRARRVEEYRRRLRAVPASASAGEAEHSGDCAAGKGDEPE